MSPSSGGGGATPADALAIVHGVGEHGGRYEHVARFFAARGLQVFALDLRGHGRSTGQRTHVEHFDEYDRDVGDFLTGVVAERAERIHLLGHSMGGLIALRHTLRHAKSSATTVLSSPPLRLPRYSQLKPVQWLVRGLARAAPRLPLPNIINGRWISRDDDVVAAYREDDLVYSRPTPSWLVAISEALQECYELASRLDRPLLLMQSGADRIVDPRGADEWATCAHANARHPETLDLTVHHWPGLFHEMFNEPEHPEVLDFMTRWLVDHGCRLAAPAAQG